MIISAFHGFEIQNGWHDYSVLKSSRDEMIIENRNDKMFGNPERVKYE